MAKRHRPPAAIDLMGHSTPVDASLPDRLAQRLQHPLPGRSAQSRFEAELSYGRHFDRPPADARQAAVIVLLYLWDDRWHVPLVLRPTTLSSHAGQIGLPGGLVEPDEESHTAALRELYEELGVPTEQVQLLGCLSPLYLFVTNFSMTPWVAVANERPKFRINATEVAELLEVPLDHLLNIENTVSHRRQERGLTFNAPHCVWGQHRIWGATGMVLSELIEILNEMSERSVAARQ